MKPCGVKVEKINKNWNSGLAVRQKNKKDKAETT